MVETEFLLYQTLENRGNHLENEKDGPYSCNWDNTWLGEGYYYWYHHIELAKWWGSSRYKGRDYIVFRSTCKDLTKCWDLHNGPGQTLFLYWLKIMKEKEILEASTTVAQVFEFIKNEYPNFPYEGVRILGVDSISERSVDNFDFVRMRFEMPAELNKTLIQRYKAYFDAMPAVQVCLFDKDGMGRVDYELVYPEELKKENRVENMFI